MHVGYWDADRVGQYVVFRVAGLTCRWRILSDDDASPPVRSAECRPRATFDALHKPSGDGDCCELHAVSKRKVETPEATGEVDVRGRTRLSRAYGEVAQACVKWSGRVPEVVIHDDAA
jgi:hypothetical protein